MNTKLHAITDAIGRPIIFFITAGQDSDYTGAAALLDELPKAKWLLADRAMMPTGIVTLYRRRGSSPAFRVGSPATKPSNTVNAGTNGATGSRSCSGVSKTRGVSLPATTDAQWSSSPPPLSLKPLSSGSDQRVLNLGKSRTL
ncbi:MULTISPECIES: transposase [Rhizobium/Agrobacterium group]|uniref:transposase n=1 Tax=Rhizobium/Agrobacterium group TaxID=227290 RepID=UPI003CCE04B6